MKKEGVTSKIKFFISYSHLDRMWIENGQYGLIPWLENSLSVLGVEFWYDLELHKNVGEKYRSKIIEKIMDSHFAVLLISQDFLNSKFIHEIEMPLIKKRVNSGQMGVIPILADYANAKLSPHLQWIHDRQMLPNDPEPLIQYINKTPQWAKVRADILDAFTHRIDGFLKAEKKQLSDGLKEEGNNETWFVTDEKNDSMAKNLKPFGEDNRLNTHLFAFDFSGILIRAAKRRNTQRRSQITLQDMICGLVRKGDLTRTVLISMNVNPDKIYKTISDYKELGEPVTPERAKRYNHLLTCFRSKKMGENDFNELLNCWIVRDITDFSTPSIEALNQTASLAMNEKDLKINEYNFLKCLLDDSAWQILSPTKLPSPNIFGDYLARIISDGQVDYNGNWNYDGLSESASMVIGRAHSLAQKYGYRPISHRVILAALIYEEDGFGRNLLISINKNTDQIIGYLLGSLSGGSSETFGMSLEICQQLITPMVKMAKKLAGKGNPVSDKHLFIAFSRLASSPFKAWLQKGPTPLNLDEIFLG